MKTPLLLLLCSSLSVSLFAQNLCPCMSEMNQTASVEWVDYSQPRYEPIALPMVQEEAPIVYQVEVQAVDLEDEVDLEEEFRESRPQRERVRKKRRNRWFRPQKRARSGRYRGKCFRFSKG